VERFVGEADGDDRHGDSVAACRHIARCRSAYGHLFPDYDDRTTRHLENLWDEAKTDNVVPIKDRRAR
jgi:hypothetical protein